MAAKSIENAALSALVIKNEVVAVECFESASELYLLHNSPEKSAECLEKAGKSIQDPVKAGELFLKACDIYEQEDKLRMGIDTFKRTLFHFIRSKNLEKAIQVSERLVQIFLKLDNRHFFHRQCMATVILCLAYGDEVDAAKRMDAYAQQPSFVSSDECTIIGSYIEAYEHRDSNLFQELKKKQIFTLLDNEIGKLALNIQVPGDVSQLNNEIEEDGFL